MELDRSELRGERPVPAETEALVRGVFDALEDAVQLCELVVDDAGRAVDNLILEVNPAYERHTSLRREQVVGRRIGEVLPVVERAWLDRYAELVRCGEPMRFEEHNTSLDRWFEVRAVPLGGSRFAAIFRDVTERRQAEEALRQKDAELHEAQRLAGIGTWRWDARTGEHWVSDDVLLLLGRSSLPAPHELASVFLGESFTRFEETGRRAVATGAPYELDLELRRPDGAPLWMTSRGEAVRDSSGAIVGLRGTLQDITERKLAEHARERCLAEVRAANEAKDLFLNTLSHELRTPLAAMLNAVEVLKNPEAGRPQRARVTSLLERSLRHQTHLIDDLLDLSRVMRGKVELALEELDLGEVAAAQVEAVEPAARKAGVALRLARPAGRVPVRGDAVRLGQVVTNLLTNAVKFSEAEGQIEIAVSVEEDQAALRVRDSGIGIEPELLPHIFEPFRQAESARVRGKGGLGIGLAVSRSLAELHGGVLEAASAGPGRGCELTLRLPCGAAPAGACARDPSQASLPSGRRVLVIDDGADLRESMSILLELLGHAVLTAPDGRSGIELARRERPDLALVDLGLPDLDGCEVARALRADPATRGLRLIALSGYAMPEHQERALAAGFELHLAKPVSAQELERLLAERPG